MDYLNKKTNNMTITEKPHVSAAVLDYIEPKDIPDFCINLHKGIRFIEISKFKDEDDLSQLAIQFENGDIHLITEEIKDFIFNFCQCEIRITDKSVIQKIFIMNHLRFIIDLYKNLTCK